MKKTSMKALDGKVYGKEANVGRGKNVSKET